MQEVEQIRTISIVGAGNLGWHMATAFHKAEISILHIIARNSSKAAILAGRVGAKPLSTNDELREKPDLILLCVSDGAIEDLSTKFSNMSPLLCHTSGSTGIELLKNEGGQSGVFYPLQTFTEGIEMDYNSIPVLIEGSSPRAAAKLKSLAKTITNSCQEVDSQTRLFVHMAAVFACNFSNHMAAIATELLKSKGLNSEILRPLIEQTYRKLESVDPSKAQTGPAVRDDYKTILKHLDALSNKPDEQEIYRLISENIASYRTKNYE